MSSDRHAGPPCPPLHLSCPPHQQLNRWRLGAALLTTLFWGLGLFFQKTQHDVKPIEANRTIPLPARGFSPVPELLGLTEGLGGDHAALHSPSVLSYASGAMEHPSSLSSTSETQCGQQQGQGTEAGGQVAQASPFLPQPQLPCLQPGNHLLPWHTMSSAEESIFDAQGYTDYPHLQQPFSLC